MEIHTQPARQDHPIKRSETLSAGTIALAYFLLVEAWDVLSDLYFTGLHATPGQIAQAVILKDLAFSVLTALLLFVVLRHEFRSLSKAGLALHESEARFHSLYENSLDGILLTAPDGKILAANPAACRIFKRSEDEICTLGRAGVVDLSDPRLEAALRQREQTGHFSSEMTLVRKDGSRFPAEVSSSVFQDGAGNLRTSMIVRDVTRRKQDELALRESEARMRLVLEKMPAVLWATDCNLVYTYAAGAAIASFGLKPEDLVGKPVAGTASGDRTGAELTLSQHQRVLREGIAESYDLQWGDRYVHIELEPLLDDAGQVIGCIGAGLDITERVRAFQLLERRVEERTHEIERRRQAAEGLRETVGLLNSDRPLEDILALTVRQSSQILRADSTGLYLRQPGDGRLALQVAAGWDADDQARRRFASNDGPVGQAVQIRAQVILRNVNLSPGESAPGHSLDPSSPEWHPGGVLAVPLIINHEVYGAVRLTYLDASRLTNEEVDLAVTLVDQAALAIESSRLRSQEGLLAVMKERNRLARELHDSVIQSIYSLTLMAEADRRRLETGEIEAVKNSLVRLGQTAQQALKEIRLLVYELRPNILEREGLVGAIQQRLDAVEGRAGVEAHLVVDRPVVLPSAVEEALYRISQEALNNALKHARASQVSVSIHSDGDKIELEIKDNGRGFDLAALPDSGGMGLNNMRERVERLGGALEILTQPGSGAVVRVTISRNDGEGR